MLQEIMNKQRELQERLGFIFDDMTDREVAQYMRDQRGYLADEIAEALYEMPRYKTWKDYSKMTSSEYDAQWAKVRMELIDALHFFVNLLLAAGFTDADDVHAMYMAKNAENHRRQDAGYTADVSYRDQPVDEVMKQFSKDTGVQMCSVYDEEGHKFSDNYIALLVQPNGAHCCINTPTVNVGVFAELLKNNYQASLDEYSEETRESIMAEVAKRLTDTREAVTQNG